MPLFYCLHTLVAKMWGSQGPTVVCCVMLCAQEEEEAEEEDAHREDQAVGASLRDSIASLKWMRGGGRAGGTGAAGNPFKQQRLQQVASITK